MFTKRDFYMISAELGNTDTIAPATAANKSMNFHLARQISFNNQVNAWLSEHVHAGVA